MNRIFVTVCTRIHDWLEDFELARLVRARNGERRIKVVIDDL